MKTIALRPRMSEKTYELSNARVYVFLVDTNVNKQEIAENVEKAYEVTVTKVRTVIVKGKAKRLYKNRRFENGTRSDMKKAYVTLKEGDAIPIFAAIEEAEEQEEKTAKRLDKAAEKQSKKDAKATAKKEKKEKKA